MAVSTSSCAVVRRLDAACRAATWVASIFVVVMWVAAVGARIHSDVVRDIAFDAANRLGGWALRSLRGSKKQEKRKGFTLTW